jgi:glutamate racemase
MQKDSPIGIFDSGFGGLSVTKSIHNLLPKEKLFYVADSAYTPYGDLPESDILKRSILIADFLVNKKNVKAIVVACNTATAFAIKELRNKFNIPIIGMEPAVKPALKVTLNNKIGVLATSGTSKSIKFSALLESHHEKAKFYIQPCPGLVNEIENGELNGPDLYNLVDKFLENFKKNAVDTIVLGCTHFIYVKPIIQKIMGSGISIIETGEAVARQLKSKLDEFDLNENLSASNDLIKIILTDANRNSSHKIAQFLAESNIEFQIENSWR